MCLLGTFRRQKSGDKADKQTNNSRNNPAKLYRIKRYISTKELIKDNKDRRNIEKAPIASLVEFFSGTESRSDLD